jgi:DNA-binding transcriptional LysR family regulator
MNDPATLDQLRVLVAVADTGSFTAAARRTHRVQSAVSHAVAAVEAQVGARLFDRTTRSARLTPAGEAFVAEARRVCARADELRRVAAGLSGEVEAAVSVVVDGVFPADALARACAGFADGFPGVQLRLHTETLSDVPARVRDGTCAFGVAGGAADRQDLDARPLGEVRMVPVIAAGHPFAGRVVDAVELGEAVQIVLSERLGAGETPDQAVRSSRTWRIHDLATKRRLLLEGLGWGNLPEHLAAEDLAAGRLARLRAEGVDDVRLRLFLLTRPGTRLGVASRWLIARLAEACTSDARGNLA